MTDSVVDMTFNTQILWLIIIVESLVLHIHIHSSVSTDKAIEELVWEVLSSKQRYTPGKSETLWETDTRGKHKSLKVIKGDWVMWET